MLKEKLLEDLKMAMKEKENNKKNVIQMVRAAILQIEKDKQVEVTDEQIVEIIAKESKKRKESIADYEKGGREDIVEQLKEEIAVLSTYLPEQLSQEELEIKLQEIMKRVGATTIKDMGKVMKVAKEEIGAAADGKVMGECVKKMLG